MGRRLCMAVVEVEHAEAKALAAALEPDNMQAPPGVRVACTAEERLVRCVVEVECARARDILTLRNTVDDLVLNLKAALDALEGGKR